MEHFNHSTKTFFMQFVLVMLVMAHYVLCDSSSALPEKQKCGPLKSYCPNSKECYAKTDRCADDISKTACPQQTGCNQQDSSFTVTFTTLGLGTYCTGVDRDLFPDIAHWLVNYRGFSYEFSSNYNLQVLDTADPNYKYARSCFKGKLSTRSCISTCTQTDVDAFSQWWRSQHGKYGMWCNNCQDFAYSLYNWLCGSCKSAKRYIDAPSHPWWCVGDENRFNNTLGFDNVQLDNVDVISGTISGRIVSTNNNFTACDCLKGCTTCQEIYCSGQSSVTITGIKIATYLATAVAVHVIALHEIY